MSIEKPRSHESKESIKADSVFYPLVNKQLQDRYDRIAPAWGGEGYANTRRDDLLPKLVEAASIESGHIILEAMCGPAILAKKIKSEYPNIEVCGLDFSIGMLQQIPSGIMGIQASVLGMPFEDATFDRVLLRTALYDLPRRMQRNALAEIARVLKEDGVFILQTYISEKGTQPILNEIANMKDRLAGQYQDMGAEKPRYFATHEELLEWFSKVDLSCEVLDSFVSAIVYQKTVEMSEAARKQYSAFMESFPEEEKSAVGIKADEDGNYTYDLPGVIYKLQKVGSK